MIIGTIILEHGMSGYFSELFALITTFAAETGDIIVQAEVHELAFCLGAYLIYMLLKPQKNPVYAILLTLTMFCFLSAFKRIGIIAIVLALVLGWGMKWFAKISPKAAFRTVTILSVAIVVVLVGYIGLIKIDIFSMLEEIGIETSGRVEIYRAVDKFYEFSPKFLGNGIGFLTYQLSGEMQVGVSSVHNDFLQYFIDLGFWGYLLWLLSMTVARVWYYGAKGKINQAIMAFVLTVYLLIVSSTDNTMNYPLLTAVLAILMIGDDFDESVRRQEMKIFGSISDANRKREGEKVK